MWVSVWALRSRTVMFSRVRPRVERSWHIARPGPPDEPGGHAVPAELRQGPRNVDPLARGVAHRLRGPQVSADREALDLQHAVDRGVERHGDDRTALLIHGGKVHPPHLLPGPE